MSGAGAHARVLGGWLAGWLAAAGRGRGRGRLPPCCLPADFWSQPGAPLAPKPAGVRGGTPQALLPVCCRRRARQAPGGAPAGQGRRRPGPGGAAGAAGPAGRGRRQPATGASGVPAADQGAGACGVRASVHACMHVVCRLHARCLLPGEAVRRSLAYRRGCLPPALRHSCNGWLGCSCSVASPLRCAALRAESHTGGL